MIKQNSITDLDGIAQVVSGLIISNPVPPRRLVGFGKQVLE
jgi:hypothetical protein